jgi:hypothetical protein
MHENLVSFRLLKLRKTIKSRKEAAVNTRRKSNTWISYIVLVLAFMAGASAISIIILGRLSQAVSEVIIAIGIVAAAGLIRLLISPLNRELPG